MEKLGFGECGPLILKEATWSFCFRSGILKPNYHLFIALPLNISAVLSTKHPKMQKNILPAREELTYRRG